MSLHLDGNQHASDFPYLFFSPCSLEISISTAFSLMQGEMHLPKPRGDPHCHCCQSLLCSFPWWAVPPPLLSGTLDRIPRTSPSWMLFCHLWEKVKRATLLRTIFMVPHFYSIFPPSHHRFPSTCYGYTLQAGRNLWYTRQIDPCIIDSFLLILGHQQLYDFSSGH